MKVQNRDYKHIARPRMARVLECLRRKRPMAIAMAKRVAQPVKR